jgi:hypothetical protein
MKTLPWAHFGDNTPMRQIGWSYVVLALIALTAIICIVKLWMGND